MKRFGYNGGFSCAIAVGALGVVTGGSTLSGTGKPGEVVWSRVFSMDGRLHVDLGRGTVLRLPEAETRRRSQATTPEWPIVHLVTHGVDRDHMMARLKANHVQIAYAPGSDAANHALACKAAAFNAMGVEVHLCGDVQLG